MKRHVSLTSNKTSCVLNYFMFIFIFIVTLHNGDASTTDCECHLAVQVTLDSLAVQNIISLCQALILVLVCIFY